MATEQRKGKKIMPSKAGKPDGYEVIQERLLAKIDSEGIAPWQQPWIFAGRPQNIKSGHKYQGINRVMLSWSGYGSPYWGTFDSMAELSGMERRTNARTGRQYWASPDGTPRGVRKGEHGTKIIFYRDFMVKTGETDQRTGDPEMRKIITTGSWTVFNAEQVDQLPAKYYPELRDTETDADAEAIVSRYLEANPSLILSHDVHGRAYYVPALDTVHVPLIGEHRSDAEYYSTVFHELSHSTGHESRLDRWTDAPDLSMHSSSRQVEELTAEFGAAFLNAAAGTASERSESNSASYLASWRSAIAADKKLAVRAASAAQKAADLILGEAAAEDSEPAASELVAA